MFTKDISWRHRAFFLFFVSLLLLCAAALMAIPAIRVVLRHYPGYGGVPGLIHAAITAGPWYCGLFVIILFAITVSILSFDAGRRQLKASTDEALIYDSRPPIVFFQSDNDKNLKNPENKFSILSYEEEIGRAFRDIGPFITIGRPADDSLSANASLTYPLEQWRTKVRDMVARAQLVVINPEPTTLCLWEIETCLRSCQPNDILLFFPFRRFSSSWMNGMNPVSERESRYKEVLSFLTNGLPIVLPNTLERTVFIGFTSLTEPIQYRQVQPLLTVSKSSMQTNMRKTLSPVLDRLKAMQKNTLNG